MKNLYMNLIILQKKRIKNMKIKQRYLNILNKSIYLKLSKIKNKIN